MPFETYKATGSTLRKTRLVLGMIAILITACLIPALKAYSSYNRTIDDVNARIDQVELGSAKTFAEKSELKPMNDKLDTLIQKTSAIEGYLRAQAHQPLPSR